MFPVGGQLLVVPRLGFMEAVNYSRSTEGGPIEGSPEGDPM